MNATLLKFPETNFPPDALPEKGEDMGYPKGEYVEPGIWLLSRNPCRYKIDVSVKIGGKQIRGRETVTGNIHEVRAARTRLYDQLRTSSLITKKKYTNISSGLAYYIRKHYRHSAQWLMGSGRAIMRFWMIQIGRRDPETLECSDINRIIHQMEADGFKPSGIIPYVSRLKTALIFARKAGLITLRPDVFADLVVLKAKKAPKLSIADEDIDRIFARIPEWARPLIIYKRLVPCRLLELYEARTEFIDLNKWSFKVTHTKIGETRVMPIPTPMHDYFRYAKESGSEWVFFREERGEDGIKVFRKFSRNYLTKCFSNAREALRLDDRIVLRFLRHATVRKWLRAVDGSVVGSVAGASEQTLKTYYDMVDITTKREAADKIALQYPVPENVVPMRKVAEA